ncbi:Protein CBG09983 [Caenorhabditis briggsae]|uniref:Protein CBG09983 n=2 Tax=Caenorhabditis TaxID=6237 RepID=A8XA36_CAEBR|nr:Protein CBG09983 [Caenorhabditis briggsae]CAP29503.2 Protein CBG09983 [Caenorhabditis briggsae]
MSSNAEAMATAFEQDGGPDLSAGSGKRTKAERVEHKHSSQPGGDTRKVVQTASNGEAKRKEKW